MADVNMFTTPFQLTKSMHRDIYPAVDPGKPALSAQGKVIMITGAGGGLGAVSPSIPPLPISENSIQAHIAAQGYRESLGSGRCCRYRPRRAYK